MNTVLPVHVSQSAHCGAAHQLRVRRDLVEAAKGKPSITDHFWLPRKSRITLYAGEVAASQVPVVLDTLLGSCVAVCIYDPVLRAGGMNHILLPWCRAGEKNPRCGVHAMELLINELMMLGGDRRRFIAKAFGGGNVFQGMKMPHIGLENARFVREYLATESIPLVAERLGGSKAVHLYFRTDTNSITVRTVDGSALPRIVATEGAYCKSEKNFRDDITLF